MGHIQLLDDNLINKIAAGEVVERPASVVKELVENSLDAGATRITVELTEGGRKRILISDNGAGMDRDDAILALRRHATSKIRKDEDLFNLHTMGFRGEALASIASVSRFTLMTCQQGAEEGVRVVSEGGLEPDISSWQSNGGTTIIVDDLFFNVPVRGKFLKTASTEYGNVLELMQSLALAWPQVDFTLVHNGREQLRATAVPVSAGNLDSTPTDASPTSILRGESELRTRFSQLFKSDAKLPMIYTSCDGPYGQMTALLSAPGVEKATGRDIYIFVNGRFVRDKALRFSILRGYHSHLLKGKFPIAILFLALDPGLVDVNVHPSKTEVRLQFASELQGMIAMAIRDGIRKAEWSGAEELGHTSPPITPIAPSSSTNTDSWFAATRSNAGVSPRSSSSWSAPVKSPNDRVGYNAWPGQTESDNVVADYTAPASRPLFTDFDDEKISAKTSSSEAVPWSELSYLGSIADCYLLFNHGERRTGARLLAVDQHAFHERIIYEQLCNKAELMKASQRLLVPEVLTFTPKEVSALVECKTIMEENGFAMDVIDSTTIELKAVPAILAKADPEALLHAFIRHNESTLPLEQNSGLAHDLLATMACHAAVRAGEPLGDNERKALLAEARAVDFFHNCPHGRRVFRWWDETAIAKWFDR